MRKSVWVILAAIICVPYILGQAPEAAMTAHPAKIKQGDNVTISAKVSPAPNVTGAVRIFIKPDSEGSGLDGANSISAGQTNTGDLNLTIPLNAKVGGWSVYKVEFEPYAGGGHNYELAISGTIRFEVVKGEDVVPPKSADVQVK